MRVSGFDALFGLFGGGATGPAKSRAFCLAVFARAFSFSILVLLGLLASHRAADAYVVSPQLEAIKVSSVGFSWQSVSFENTYVNPVAVCVYNLPSAASPPATVRLTSVGASGMQVKIQQFPNSSSVTAGDVHCLIAEAGAHTLPDGRAFEARTAISTATHGQNAANGWSMGALNNVSASVTGSYANPAVLAQVMTFNDSNASVAYVNDCDSRGNPPFASGMADGMCVSKHIGQMSGSRSNETIGFIISNGGSGSFGDVAYELNSGSDSVAGTGNAPPYSYGLSTSYDVGVATQQAEDGGNGGWAVLYGANPLAGAIDLAVEEETAAGDTTRRHTNEEIDYWVFRFLPEFALNKTVDVASTADAIPLNYNIVLDNTGQIDLTGVTVVDTLPDASTGTLSGPVESFAGGTAGVLEPGETWTYTTSYSVTAGDISAGTPLINSVSAGNAQYTSEGLANETSSAATAMLPPAPSVSITKTANDDSDVTVGQIITYTYVVTNTGNQTLSDISLSDVHGGSGIAPVPDADGATLTDNGTIGDSSNTTTGDSSWDVLAPGDTITVTATYEVTQSDVDGLQ